MKTSRGKTFDRLRFALLTALTLLPVLFAVAPASAASNSLGVTPRKDYTINSGGSITDTIFIDNLSKDSALTVTTKVVDFKSQGESGTPALQLQANAQSLPYSLKPFLTVPKTVTLQPSASAYVPITIQIPKSQGAGSYYSAILYSANGTGGSKNVNLQASTGTLIFVTVPGKANEILNLNKFGAYTPATNTAAGHYQSTFISSQPTELAYTVTNQGNVAESPSGSILVKNEYGKVVANITQANPNQDLALIGQTRLFETCIKTGQKTISGADGQSTVAQVCVNPNLPPGHYSALLETLYGINGNTTQQITASTSFWYLPPWFILLSIAIVVILVVLIWVIVHAIRKGRKQRHHHRQ